MKRGLAGIAEKAVARLDLAGGPIHLSSYASDRGGVDLARRPVAAPMADPVAEVRAFASSAPGFGWLPDADHGAGWSCYRLRLASGRCDALALQAGAGMAPDTCCSVVEAVWSVLREDVLAELAAESGSEATAALMWMVSKRLGAAVMVLDAEGRVVEANAAAADLLAAGLILREDRTGLAARSPAETRALRRALAECSHLDDGKEYILFLDGGDDAPRLPLSLSRYPGAGGAPLIVAVLAARPDPRRVEMLALKMGLTPAEARVASLMQLGLSNREAAYIAGLKEQTFNTYSKRVLAKLHVTGRAEMAQMLTWQAGLGRAS